MVHPDRLGHRGVMTSTHVNELPSTDSVRPSWYRGDDDRQRQCIESALAKASFGSVATTSAAGFPHVAGVAIAADGWSVFLSTHRSSRKARNVDAGGKAALVVPVRRLPVGPPFTIQFQADATLLEPDHPEIVAGVARGGLASVTGHGELDLPDGCFIRLRPTGRIHTYGIGVSTFALLRDPLSVGARSVELA